MEVHFYQQANCAYFVQFCCLLIPREIKIIKSNLDKLQTKTTKLIPILRNNSYDDRLSILFSSEAQRLLGQIIEVLDFSS